MAQINPYLLFKGNCKEAFDFYKSVFNKDFSTVKYYKDVPVDAQAPINTNPDKIMYISLQISNETYLMGADVPDQAVEGNMFGDAFSISIEASSKDEFNHIYSQLSDNGSVIMPITNTFWGELFSIFTDKYGVKWILRH